MLYSTSIASYIYQNLTWSEHCTDIFSYIPDGMLGVSARSLCNCPLPMKCTELLHLSYNPWSNLTENCQIHTVMQDIDWS